VPPPRSAGSVEVDGSVWCCIFRRSEASVVIHGEESFVNSFFLGARGREVLVFLHLDVLVFLPFLMLE
jgi:hypothetical protein